MFAATTHPFLQSLEHLTGFILVLVALGMLWALTVLIGQFFKGAPVPTPGRAAAAPAAAASEAALSEEEVVAITASVAMLFGQRSRIVSIRSSAHDWNREGRREHFASHRIR